jgi:ATP-dependent Clp protease ATP-binding subunit ClpC
MFERFTDRARRVVVLAQEEARMLDHNYIGTEHLLLGLVHEGEGVAAESLDSLGISLETVRTTVEQIIGRGQQMPSGHIPFTPRAKKVLELSLREALQLGHNYIGTEHLLLGLIREGEGVAAQVLVKLGAKLDLVRQRVIQVLADRGGDEPGIPHPAPRTGQSRRERKLLSEVIGHVELIDARLSAVEQRTGTGPDTAEVDREIAQARRDKESAIGAEDYEKAATLRDRERQLLADKASRQEEWVAAHPDLPALAGGLYQLNEEVERLRSLLRQQGIEPQDDAPKDGTA